MIARPTNAWFTWRGKPRGWQPLPDAECLQSCIENAEQAARDFAAAARRYERAEPGSKELAQAYNDRHRAYHEQRHWRQLADWYRKRIEARPATASAEPPVRERQPGEDDDEYEQEARP